ncbi:MAG: hypothetical protein AAF321_00880 [Pseudomonadota bacterium]
MLISGYGAGTNLTLQIRQMQDQMGDLQRQLATGKVSRDFAGLGGGRDVSLTMRAQLSKSSSYDQTISFVSGRLEATQLVLQRVEDILNDTAGGTLESNIELTSEGKSVQQMLADKRFEEMLALLNTEYEDRSLFSGRKTDGSSNIGADAIMNGKNGRDGLLAIIDERQAADVAGANGANGRIGVAASGANGFTLTDEANPFGMKLRPGSQLTSLPASGTDASVAGPPNTISFDLGATNPSVGNWISFEVAMPDGTNETIRLQAGAQGARDPEFVAVAGTYTPPLREPDDIKGFEIGTTVADTAANLEAAVNAALAELAAEKLPNAGAIQAAEDFFAYDDPDSTTHPMRVNATQDGWEPVATAQATTVLWYTGEVGGGRARDSAIAKIDDNLKVSYGARANEDLFKDTLAALAVFASEDFPVDDTENRSRYMDMADRVRFSVSGTETDQRSRAMQADFASVQVAVDEARQRHRFRDVLAEDMIDRVESADDNLVATQLLALQTQLQMSFQTTSILSRLSLANVL